MALGALLLASGAGVAAWLYRGAPGLERTPGWFYQAVNKGSFDMLLVAAAAACLPGLVRLSARLARGEASGSPRRQLGAAAATLVLGSLLLQLATGLVARHGVRGWTERFFVGHGEFTTRARAVPDALALLRNYEELAAGRQLGLYGPSKPPGTYAVYLAIDRSARWPIVRDALAPLGELLGRDPAVPADQRALFAWTIVLLCLCAALTTVPLVGLAAVLFAEPRDRAVFTYPAWLLASAPVMNVITVHLDSTLFPLLSASALCASALSLRARTRAASLAWAALGGGLGTLAVYCSYGNLPILALSAALMLALALEQAPEFAPRGRATALALLGFAAGVLALLLVLRLGLHWQPVAGYLRGVAYHKAWQSTFNLSRSGNPDAANAWRHGLALVEFGVFAGPPLMLAFFTACVLGVSELARKLWPRGLSDPPAYGLWTVTLGGAAIMLVISLALGTPEAARLWLFMLPWVCCAAAGCMAHPSFWPTRHVLLGVQLVLAFFVKNYLVW